MSNSNVISGTQVIADQKRIADLKKELTALTASQPKKDTPIHVINKRETVAMLTAELMTLSKTSKVVLAHLKTCDLITYKTMCSPKAQDAIFADRWPELIKSPSLVIKCLTPSQKNSFIELGNKCTPSAYLGAIERGLSMSAAK